MRWVAPTWRPSTHCLVPECTKHQGNARLGSGAKDLLQNAATVFVALKCTLRTLLARSARDVSTHASGRLERLYRLSAIHT
jgi:hypothetical protein